MEPLAALSLVSSVVQILDFAANLVSETRDFLKSSNDALPRNDWIEGLAETNKGLAEELKASTASATTITKAEAAVQKLATRCLKKSVEIVTLLQPLKVPIRADGSKSRRKALVQILKSNRKTGDIEAHARKLESYERQLSALLLYCVRTSQAEEFAALKKLTTGSGQRSIEVIRNTKAELLSALDTRIELLRKSVDTGFARVEKKIDEEHKMRNMIGLVESLRYPEMDNRRSAIEERHPSTFNWIYSDRESPFSTWLERTSGCFWVCGDIGTGKSTFMKYLASHPETQDRLQLWAGDRQLMIAAHFFWVAGASIERSLQGLLQHLLYQLLSEDLTVVNEIRPVGRSLHATGKHIREGPRSCERLFEIVAKITAQEDRAICFFIDGLDECEENSHMRLIKFLTQISARGNVKVCASSRPWNIFEREFGGSDNKFFLQDLTRLDIFDYVCERLHSADSEAFSESLCNGAYEHIFQSQDGALEHLSDPATAEGVAQKLIVEIVLEAQGVFLWVSVVLDTLCTRLLDGYKVGQLRRYIKDFPKKLEDYFERLVYERICDTYKTSDISETAMAFRIALARVETGDTMDFVFFWLLRVQSLDNVSLITEEAFGEHIRLRMLTQMEVTKMTEETRSFLAGCCKDLLHLPESTGKFLYFPVVSFKHRTMYDFLKTSRMQSIINTHVPAHFNEPDFLWQLHLTNIKFVRQDGEFSCRAFVWGCRDFLIRAAGLQGSERCRVRALSAADETIPLYFDTMCRHGYQCLFADDAIGEDIVHVLALLAASDNMASAMRVLQRQPLLAILLKEFVSRGAHLELQDLYLRRSYKVSRAQADLREPLDFEECSTLEILKALSLDQVLEFGRFLNDLVTPQNCGHHHQGGENTFECDDWECWIKCWNDEIGKRLRRKPGQAETCAQVSSCADGE